jgi:hypothetical protein
MKRLIRRVSKIFLTLYFREHPPPLGAEFVNIGVHCTTCIIIYTYKVVLYTQQFYWITICKMILSVICVRQIFLWYTQHHGLFITM